MSDAGQHSPHTPAIDGPSLLMKRLLAPVMLWLLAAIIATGCSPAPASPSGTQKFPMAVQGRQDEVVAACLRRLGVRIRTPTKPYAGRIAAIEIPVGRTSEITFFRSPQVARNFARAVNRFAGGIERIGSVTFDHTGIPHVDHVIRNCISIGDGSPA
jgi:hypothetical protein